MNSGKLRLSKRTPNENFLMSTEFLRWEEVPRETNISRERFESDYFSRQLPVVVSGKLSSWRALNEWSPEFLKEFYGDVSVHASLDIPERKDGSFQYWGSGVHWMPLNQFIDHIETSDELGSGYIRQSPSNFFADLNNYFDFDILLDMEGRNAGCGLWFGSKGTDSGVHWDTDSNILAHIYGKKHAILFAPSDSKYLYPYRDQIRWTSFSAFEPTFTSFPNARNATPYFVELNPGDALHIPRGWWHQVISLSTAISINCFFQPSCSFPHFMRSVAYAGPMHVAQTIRDFVTLGIFQKQLDARQIISDIPTGHFLYNIVRDAFARRLGKS